MKTYIAFLRGINVGGHHKVPMANLKIELQKLGFKKVITLLNSGNIIFNYTTEDTATLEQIIANHLEKTFNFPIPTMVRTAETLQQLLNNNPFSKIELTKDRRFYISFLKTNSESDLQLPWKSEDSSYKILENRAKNIFSVLDVSISKTTKAMGTLERSYGKDITTRNWNTILRIEQKLKA